MACSYSSKYIFYVIFIFLVFESWTVWAKTRVCYLGVGCFTTDSPWRTKYRPTPAPEDPLFLNTGLNFFSKVFPDVPFKVDVYPWPNLRFAGFDPKRKSTVFIFPGYDASPIQGWMKDLKNAILKHHDFNVFLVDCSGAVRELNWFVAVSNSRVVGVQIGQFIEHLAWFHGQSLLNVHLIGHDLGAQIAGYTGKYLNGTVGRITGLDPVQWLFEDVPSAVRLSSGDALFVDVIHTDSRAPFPDLGFGILNPVGHVDWYINGGHGQPQCGKLSPPQIRYLNFRGDQILKYAIKWGLKIFLCGHHRSVVIFTESIEHPECTFWGHNATIKNFMKGIANSNRGAALSTFTTLSGTCDYDTCMPLGLEAVNARPRGVFIVTTNPSAPFCNKGSGTAVSQDSPLVAFISHVLQSIFGNPVNKKESTFESLDFLHLFH